MPLSKRVRRTGVLILTILGIFCILVLFLNFYLRAGILAAIKERINKGSHGKYTLTANKLSVNLFLGNLTFDSVTIAPPDRKVLPNGAFYILNADNFEVRHFSIIKYLREKIVSVDELILDGLNVSVFQDSISVKGKKNKEVTSIYEMIAPDLHSLMIGKIRSEDSRISIFRNSDDTSAVVTLPKSSVLMENFRVDKSCQDLQRVFLADRFEVRSENVSIHMTDKFYTLFMGKLSASFTDSLVRVDSLQLVPDFSEKEFGRRTGRQVTRVELYVPVLRMTGLDVERMVEQNVVGCRSMITEGVRLNAYRDNNIRLAKIKRPSVQSLIRDAPVHLSIDTVWIVKGTIEYREIPEGSNEVAVMKITDLNSIGIGMTNDTSSGEKKFMKMSMSSRFMDKCWFVSEISFSLDSRDEVSYCKGGIGPLTFTDLNPLVAPAKQIVFRKGHIDTVQFEFTTSSANSKGQMKMLYKDLEVDMPSGEKQESDLKKTIKEFVANKIILKNDNPQDGGEPRVVIMGVTKNPYRMYPYFFMQTLMSGITASIQGEVTSRILKKTRLLQQK